jgi:hypothetical protein
MSTFRAPGAEAFLIAFSILTEVRKGELRAFDDTASVVCKTHLHNRVDFFGKARVNQIDADLVEHSTLARRLDESAVVTINPTKVLFRACPNDAQIASTRSNRTVHHDAWIGWRESY